MLICMNMYQEHLMDHYRHPRNRGVIERPHFISEEQNPSCGDSVSMSGLLENDNLITVCFTGAGCVISQAAASMLTERVIGLSLTDILQLQPDYMRALIQIPLGPTRLKCALLALEALQSGLNQLKRV